MNMKKYITLLFLSCLFIFSSCLKSGLDDIENSDLCAEFNLQMQQNSD